MVNKNKLLLIIVFVSSLLFQLRNISTPPFNAYDWRQWDTFSVIRNFRQEGMNIISPRTNQIYIESPNVNERLFLLDFPIYSYLSALLSHISGINSLTPRLINIVSGAIVSVLLFNIIKNLKYKNWIALSAVFLLNVSPLFQFSIISIQPDMLMLLFFTLAFKSLILEKDNFSESIIFTSLSTLIKPYTFLILLPLIIYKYLRKSDQRYFYYLIPPFLYFLWLMRGNFSESGRFWYHSQSWVLTFVNSWGFDIQKIGLEFFKRIIISTITLPVLILMVFGFKNLSRELKINFLFIITGFLIFFINFLPGNYNHLYYQLPLLLPIYILAVIGLNNIVANKNWIIIIFVAIFIPSFITTSKETYSSLFKQHDIYINLNNWQFDQDVIPSNKSVLYFNEERSPVLLNMINRNGWIYPISGQTCSKIEEKIKNLKPDYSLIFTSYINRDNKEDYFNDSNLIICLQKIINKNPIYKQDAVTVFKINN